MQFLRPIALKKLLQSSLNTHKHFITRFIAMLFSKNHNRNTPELTRNLAEQTKNPIETHCKPCKIHLWHKNQSKTNKMNEILKNWGALQFLAFFQTKWSKSITTLNWRKQRSFVFFSRYPETSVQHCVPCVVPWLVCLTRWNLNEN